MNWIRNTDPDPVWQFESGSNQMQTLSVEILNLQNLDPAEKSEEVPLLGAPSDPLEQQMPLFHPLRGAHPGPPARTLNKFPQVQPVPR